MNEKKWGDTLDDTEPVELETTQPEIMSAKSGVWFTTGGFMQ
jgi:hypothetical protein